MVKISKQQKEAFLRKHTRLYSTIKIIDKFRVCENGREFANLARQEFGYKGTQHYGIVKNFDVVAENVVDKKFTLKFKQDEINEVLGRERMRRKVNRHLIDIQNSIRSGIVSANEIKNAVEEILIEEWKHQNDK